MYWAARRAAGQVNALPQLILEAGMSKPPLPEAAVAMLRKPNPAVITTLRRDGHERSGRAVPARETRQLRPQVSPGASA